MKQNRNKLTFQDILIRLERINRYCSGDITLGDFLDYKRGTHGKFTTEWPELFFLRYNIEKLYRFLLALPTGARRLVIMREEIIGFSRHRLYSSFGINNDKMKLFTEIETDNVINSYETWVGNRRKVIPDASYPVQFLAFVSLLSRIPMQWLMNDKPDLTWNTSHFGLLDDVHISSADFIPFLNRLNPSYHDVRGVVLIDKPTEIPLYLRVENLNGTVTVELCNTYAHAYECQRFKELFNGVYFAYGDRPTVIPSQINKTIIWKHPKSLVPICLPIEFDAKRSLY